MKIVVSKDAVREYVREAMNNPSVGWQSSETLEDAPVSVSSIVDPSAAVTDPSNPNFKPANRVELRTAISTMVDGISDDDASDFYSALKDHLDAKEKDDENMRKKDNKVEEAVRQVVRKILREAAGSYKDTGMSYSGPGTGTIKAPEGFESCEECDGTGETDQGTDCKVCKGRGYVKSSKRDYRKGDASYSDMGKELGVGTSRARDILELGLEKFKSRWQVDPDDLEILILSGINDYIQFLQKSGELTAADVQLLKDHPKVLWSMDGAQEYVANFIDKSMQGGTLKL